jgi:hypothetical protein
MKQTSIKYISTVHSDSLRTLNFYLEELMIFQKRLEEIAMANSGMEIAIQVEHFQNLFIIHKKQIEKIANLLHENIKFISSEVHASSGYLDEALLMDNFHINEQFLEEEKLFREMKTEFYQFAAKWM